MQIRINPIRPRKKAMRAMNAATVATEAQWMLHQLSLPVAPKDTIKARRERAIRRAGLSHAKGFRVWHGYAAALMAHEYLTICEAFKAHVRTQEAHLTDELEQLRSLRAARELRERHGELDLPMGESDLGAVDRETSNP
jgi:hypothetical protein